MPSEPASHAAQLAEAALTALAAAAGDHARDLIVVGGLTPPVLASRAAVPHHGTSDVDLLVEVGLVYDDDVDLRWLEPALDEGGFRAVGDGSRWWWKEAPVYLDLVCDRPGSAHGPIPLPGCSRAAATNVAGPRAARCDPAPRALHLPPERGGGTVSVLFAGLGGYLLSKASAAVTRREPRDFYDFYFVALHNDDGGPPAAAAAMSAGACAAMLDELRPAVRYTLRAALAGDREAAHAYASEMRVMGDETALEVLVEDAATAAEMIATRLAVDVR